MTNGKIKISAAAYRVLLLLLNLNKQECSFDYLNNIFAEDSYISRYFSQDVILKYISTLRTAGYDISRPTVSNNYTYELNKSPVLFSFEEEHLKTLALMRVCAESMQQVRIIKSFDIFLKKIKKFLTEEQVAFLNRQIKKQKDIVSSAAYSAEAVSKENLYRELIQKIEIFQEQQMRVSVKYCISEYAKGSSKNTEKCDVIELNEIKYKMDGVYVSGYSTISSEPVVIKIDEIQEMKSIPSKVQGCQVFSTVIFKLSGRLAKIYRPYENEKILPGNNDHNISVVVSADDKQALIRRLLKYKDSCEVLYPKHFRHEVAAEIEKMLKNYE